MSSVGPGSADWDDIYLGDGSDTEPFDDQLLADALELIPGRALDLGCGGGGNAIGLARRGWNTTGVDSATNAIRSARISAEAAHVEVRFAVADMTTWPPDGLYDLVVCSYSLPPRGRDRQALLATAVQALAPGGVLVVGEWEASGGAPNHFPTLSELTDALSDLEIIRAESVNSDPHLVLGTSAAGSWPSVVVTARRPA